MARLEDIAREAHVSIATVSRVLNGNPSVSLSLRKAVLDVVSSSNHLINEKKQFGNSGGLRLIGVIVPDITNPIYGNIIKGIDSVVRPLGFSIVVCDYMDDMQLLVSKFEMLSERGIDGAVFTSPVIPEFLLKQIRKRTYPIVSVLSEPNEFEGFLNVVNIDNESAMASAVSFLYKLGHRRIAFLSGIQTDESAGKKRLQGYYKGLQECGIPLIENYIFESEFTVDGGYAAMRVLYEENEVLPTAVLAACDNMAVGAINYLLDNGLEVPKDISIMGFDDLPICTACRPQLTTIRHCTIDHGVAAANLIIEQIIDRSQKPQRITMPYKIIRRQSVSSLST